MNLKTKKIIAREFLLLLLCVAIGLCAFLGVYLYSSYKANKLDDLKGEIKANKVIIDSLQRSISIKYDEYGIPIKNYGQNNAAIDNNLKSIVQRMIDENEAEDNIAKVIRTWPFDQNSLANLEIKRRHQLDGNIQEMLKNGASNEDVIKYALDFKLRFLKDPFKEFGGHQLPPPPPKKIILELASKGKLIEEDTIKLGEYSKQIISSKNQARISQITFFASLSCVFLLRYLFYGIRWSLNALKEK